MLAGAADATGVVGAALISGLYLLNQMGRLETTDWRFPGSNLAGSLLIFLSLVETFNLPSVLIELFWSAISVFGLVRALRLRKAGEAGLSLRLPFQRPKRAVETFGQLPLRCPFQRPKRVVGTFGQLRPDPPKAGGFWKPLPEAGRS